MGKCLTPEFLTAGGLVSLLHKLRLVRGDPLYSLNTRMQEWASRGGLCCLSDHSEQTPGNTQMFLRIAEVWEKRPEILNFELPSIHVIFTEEDRLIVWAAIRLLDNHPEWCFEILRALHKFLSVWSKNYKGDRFAKDMELCKFLRELCFA